MNPSSARPHLLRGVLIASLLTAAALLPAASPRRQRFPPSPLRSVPPRSRVGGTLQSGAVNVVSTATGGKEPSTSLVLLKPGVSVAEVYALLDAGQVGKEPNLVSKYASIMFDGTIAPAGKSTEAQTILQPGQYVAVDAEGEKSSKWPRTSFTVTAAAAPATLPAAAGYRALDRFRLPRAEHTARRRARALRKRRLGRAHGPGFPGQEQGDAQKMVIRSCSRATKRASKSSSPGNRSASRGRFQPAAFSRRRSPPSPAGTCRRASWTPRTVATTRRSAWSGSSRSSSSAGALLGPSRERGADHGDAAVWGRRTAGRQA